MTAKNSLVAAGEHVAGAVFDASSLGPNEAALVELFLEIARAGLSAKPGQAPALEVSRKAALNIAQVFGFNLEIEEQSNQAVVVNFGSEFDGV